MMFLPDRGDGLHVPRPTVETILRSALTLATMTDTIGPSPEMYLKTLHELSVSDRPVSISAVADRMGVSPVSASEMIHRLEERRLVRHRRYHGVTLTRSGREHAKSLIRRHRLWECFLHEELGLPWQAVHDLACELEHAAPDEVTEALNRRLQSPAKCPHGNPIPSGAAPERPTESPGTPLADLSQGDLGAFLSIHPETSEDLEYLARHGFLPGTEFRLERIEVADQLRVLRHAGGTIVIGPSLTARLRVRGTATRP